MASCPYCNALLPSDVPILLCPECGNSLPFDRRGLNRKGIPKGVDMTSQTYLTFIPFANLIAAYRLNKLGKTVLRVIVDIIFLFLLMAWIATMQTPQSFNLNSLNPSGLSPLSYGIYVIIVSWLIPSLIMLHFIRRWTSEWNRMYPLRSRQSLGD